MKEALSDGTMTSELSGRGKSSMCTNPNSPLGAFCNKTLVFPVDDKISKNVMRFQHRMTDENLHSTEQ